MTQVMRDLGFLLLKVAIIILAFLIIFTFVFGLLRYAEPSMTPSVKDGDLVIFHRYNDSGYAAKDAIVFEFEGEKQIRRVIAVQGDTVDITEEGLVINGAPQQEPGIGQKTERYAEGVDFPLTIPDGHVFVLADYRTGAADSRIYGPVKIENTLGKVMAVLRLRDI